MGDKRQQQRQAWKNQIELWQASEVSAAAFCREHGLNYNSFLYWKGKLNPPTGFTRIDTSPEEEAGVILECRGLSIRLSRSFDKLTLRRALVVIGSRC